MCIRDSPGAVHPSVAALRPALRPTAGREQRPSSSSPPSAMPIPRCARPPPRSCPRTAAERTRAHSS
eukprot:14328758-Alexandrium_andersonii.AAC.1